MIALGAVIAVNAPIVGISVVVLLASIAVTATRPDVMTTVTVVITVTVALRAVCVSTGIAVTLAASRFTPGTLARALVVVLDIVGNVRRIESDGNVRLKLVRIAVSDTAILPSLTPGQRGRHSEDLRHDGVETFLVSLPVAQSTHRCNAGPFHALPHGGPHCSAHLPIHSGKRGRQCLHDLSR